LPINNTTAFSPFNTGVFDGVEPDYTEFDTIVNDILKECPDAFIFPRINITMPEKWLIENVYETVETPCGINRESLFSENFREDGIKLLKELVSHIRKSKYANRIAGYQLCGGTTQEWIHHDLFGSFSEMGKEKFKMWLKEKYKRSDITDITKDDFNCGDFNERASLYGEFCCEKVAETIEFFAKELKEFINNEQVVGVFYGYNVFVNDYLWGLHGLRFIIDSPYIDFFSSPCGYDDNRKLGIDWGDMLPVNSLKLHNKLYFVECDVRTHLTTRMQNSRPGRYSDNMYLLTDENGNKTAWSGPETEELSISALYKAFSHQLAKGSGIWWFDMWGGWYHSESIMSELKKMKRVFETLKDKKTENCLKTETVLFIDEKAYLNNPRGSEFCHSVNIMRMAMGNTGIPYDIYMVEDAKGVVKNYKTAIFPAPLSSENGKKAARLCEKLGVPYLATTKEKLWYSTDEIREFLVSNGVHCYNSDGNVIYCGNSFLGVHAKNDGELKITLPKLCKIKPLQSSENMKIEANEIVFNMKRYETVLLELE
jgi:beta-galactosidase